LGQILFGLALSWVEEAHHQMILLILYQEHLNKVVEVIAGDYSFGTAFKIIHIV